VFLLRPSGKFSWLILAVGGLLTALLFFVVEEVPRPATSLLFSDLLQTAIVLWAALCSLLVARRSFYLRQLWILLAASLFLGCAAQALETYYQCFAQAPSLTPWPSDILFILWVTPAVMMLLPRPEKESGAIDWQQVLDFAQIGVVALTVSIFSMSPPAGKPKGHGWSSRSHAYRWLGT